MKYFERTQCDAWLPSRVSYGAAARILDAVIVASIRNATVEAHWAQLFSSGFWPSFACHCTWTSLNDSGGVRCSGRRRLFPEDVDTDTQQPKRSSDHHKVLPLSPCPPKPISARVDKANSFCPADSAECILDIISNGAEKEHAVSSSHNKPEKTTPVKPKIAKRKSPRNHSSTSLSPVSTGRKVVRKLSFFDSPSFSISYLVSPPKPSTRKGTSIAYHSK